MRPLLDVAVGTDQLHGGQDRASGDSCVLRKLLRSDPFLEIRPGGLVDYGGGICVVGILRPAVIAYGSFMRVLGYRRYSSMAEFERW